MKSFLSPLCVRLPFTFPLVVRYLLITLLLTGFVLGAWSSITPIAHAASHAAATTKHTQHSAGGQQPPLVASQPGTQRRHPATIGTGAVNGLGILPFYTYITERLTDHTSLSVNVANGNLVIDSHNLSSMTDPTGTTSYTYDKDNRVLTKTLPGGTQLTYTYDPVGSLLTFTDGGGQVSYGYNQVNELVTLTEPGGAKTTFGYDAAGQRTSTSYPNGVVMSMVYDQAGHVNLIKEVKGTTTLIKFGYAYGSAELATGSTDMNLNSTTYTYGRLNELTSSTQGTTTTYSYDAAGNLSGWSSGGLSFSYNSLNQTTAISGNNYSYSGPDQTDRVQANSTSYVYSFNGISSQTDSSGTTYYTRCSCAKGTLVDERTPAGAYYYLFDGLGSIVGLTDSNGTLVSTYQYDPYGNLTSSTGSVANPWRFAGGYFDSSTGLYKYGTRYYNPGFGRWSQQDPVRGHLDDPTSLNRYVYAGDDPVNVTDPSGRDCIDAATTGCTRAGGTGDSWVQRWGQFVFFLCGLRSRK